MSPNSVYYVSVYTLIHPTSEAMFKEALIKANKIHTQQKSDRDKIYFWHAHEVVCISKGKAHKPYEFGWKVSITTDVNLAPAGHFR